MNVQELIEQLKKLPPEKEVRFAVERGHGKRALYPINKTEVARCGWVYLS